MAGESPNKSMVRRESSDQEIKRLKEAMLKDIDDSEKNGGYGDRSQTRHRHKVASEGPEEQHQRSNNATPNPSTQGKPPIETKPRRTIGHYNIEKSIGEGTFGKVKLGTHHLTGEKVAIKILEKDRITDVSDVERVAREIHILKLIRHQNIIQLYEIIETPKQLYLIMEYASGGELFDYIVANTRLKEEEACKFFQ